MKNLSFGSGLFLFILASHFLLCSKSHASVPRFCEGSGALNASELRVNDLNAPMDLAKNRRVVFSWTIQTTMTANSLIGYRLLVASTRKKLLIGESDIWDSGFVTASDPNSAEYQGVPLESGAIYYWAVSVIGSEVPACFSSPAIFATGFDDDWDHAEFIQAASGRHSWLVSAVRIKEDEVESAVIRFLAEDRFKVMIGGRFVGIGPTRGFEPVGPSKVDVWLARLNAILLGEVAINNSFKINSTAFEVSGLLKRGEMNPIFVQAKGAVRIHLRIRYENGESQDFVSDESWFAKDVTLAVERRVPGFQSGMISPIGIDPAGRQVVDLYEHIDGQSLDFASAMKMKSVEDWSRARVRRQLFFRGRVMNSSTLPLESRLIAPVSVAKTAHGSFLLDFGSIRIGSVSLNGLQVPNPTDIELRYGTELMPNGSVRYRLQEFHGSNIEFREAWKLRQGENRSEHFGWRAFRWLEVIGLPANVDVRRINVRSYKYASSSRANFNSNSSEINRFWEVVKHTQEALTLDVYMDTPNRERMPYEADAYINSQCHSVIDREFALMRLMVRYFIANPTWPTEWRFYPIAMAYENYLRDGNKDELQSIYFNLKRMSQTQFAQSKWGGLIDPPTEPVIDWPKSERGGFIQKDLNVIENSFYFWGLSTLKKIASELGLTSEAALYAKLAHGVEREINRYFWNSQSGRYRDGIGAQNEAWVSSIIPIALGITPPSGLQSIRKSFAAMPENEFVSSPYVAYWVLKALFRLGLSEKATRLMLARGTRTWYNMIIRNDASTTFESWDPILKENMSRNHPWSCGIVPILVQDVIGLRALSAGFKSIEIRPQMGVLKKISVELPTLRGNIKVEVTNADGGRSASLRVILPAQTTATLCLPLQTSQSLNLNGKVFSRSNRSTRYECVYSDVKANALSIVN